MPTTWTVDEPHLDYTPGSWDLSGSSFARSVRAGAEVSFGFTGTSCAIALDLTGVDASAMLVSYRVDGGTRHVINPTATVTLASGLAPGYHRAVVADVAQSSGVDCYAGPAESLKLTSIILDDGASLAASPPAPAFRLAVFGDSISAGVKASPDGATPDYNYSYSHVVASALGARPCLNAFPGSGWSVTAGASGIPPFATILGAYTSGRARSLSGLFDAVIVNLGTNDPSGISATVASGLSALRAAVGASVPILLVVPFGGFNRADLRAGAASYGGTAATHALAGTISYRSYPGDPHFFLIDLGAAAQAGIDGTSGGTATAQSPDGTHPNTATQAALGNQLLAALAAAVPGIGPMSYTVFDEIFSGTPGAAITGAGGSPVRSATDAWGTFSTIPPLAYKAGGGATTSTVAGGVVVSAYPLTGVAQDIDLTVSLTNASQGSSAGNPLIQFHRTADGNNYTSISLDFQGNVVNLVSGVGGTSGSVTSDGSFGAFAANTAYTLHIRTAGGTITVATLNGTTLNLIQGATIPTGSGSVLLLGQAAGSVGDVTFTRATVTVSGPTTATVTGPANLTTGVASSNYTITLGSAVPTGGPGISFTPAASGFSATPSPSSVTIASGSTAGTFTETTSTAGTGTVSATSAGITVTGQSATSSAASTPATSYALTAPSPASGFVGIASANFTVTANGTPATTLVVTPSDGGDGGTFAPTSLSIADGAAHTFTYSPASAGTKSISVSHTGGSGISGNPSAVAYAATAAPVAGLLNVYYPAPSLSTVYFALLSGSTAWNGSGFESISAGHWPSYAIPGADLAGVNLYSADIPGLAAGTRLTILGYLRGGSTPAPGDLLIGREDAIWTGSTLVSPPTAIDLSQALTDTTSASVGGALNGAHATAWQTVVLDKVAGLLKVFSFGSSVTPKRTFTYTDNTAQTTRAPG